MIQEFCYRCWRYLFEPCLQCKEDEMVEAIQQGVDYTEPCVCVQKMREFGANERFDRWCIKHHHWLNDKPAIGVVDTLLSPPSTRNTRA